MMTTKIKYLGLFSIACIAAYFSEIPGLGLLLVAVWMQVANAMWHQDGPHEKQLTKQSQILYLRYFLFSIPIILIFGSINSFFPLFWQNMEIMKLLSINSIQFLCSFLICTFMVFGFAVRTEETRAHQLFIAVLKYLRPNMKMVLHLSLVFWIMNFIFVLFSTNEYLWVAAFALIHLYQLQLVKMKPVVLNLD